MKNTAVPRLEKLLFSLLLGGLLLACAHDPPPPPLTPSAPAKVEEWHPDLSRLVPPGSFFQDYPEWTSPVWDRAEVRAEGGLLLLSGEQPLWILEILEGPALRFREASRVDGQSYAVLEAPRVADSRARVQDGLAVLEGAGLRVEVDARRQRFRLALRGQAVEEFTLPERARGSARFRLRAQGSAGDQWYGLGMKAWGLRLNGGQFHFWNTDTYGYRRGTDPIYSSVPFALRARANRFLGVFLDNPAQAYFFLGRDEEPAWSFGALGGEIDVYLIPASTPAEVMQTYTALTGRTPLPPLWSLGYQQSRYSYTDREELEAVAQTLRRHRLPSDVLYLDIDVMDRHRSFTINHDAFPDIAGMLAGLAKMGFKVVTILDPGIARVSGYHVYDQLMEKGFYVRDRWGRPVEAEVWPGVCVFPDFTRQDVRLWWGELYQPLLELGFAGFWNDMNEPAAFRTPTKTLPWEALFHDFGRDSPHALVHNAYGSKMARATHEGLRRLRPNQRPFVLSRAGFAGLQRWAAQWTGDNTSNWDHLALHLTMGLNQGLSGMAFTGADVGGYVGSPDSELFVRWMQLGALFPLYRNHTGKDTAYQEPWNFGEEALRASRLAMEWRYRLLPLFYALMREAERSGAPVARPLFWHDFQDPRTFVVEDQLLLGPHLMAAPVLHSGARRRQVYFPPGVWFDWYTAKEYLGGRSYEVEAPLDRLPLFVRGGGLVPTGETMQFVGEKPRNVVTVRVYPGGRGSALVYWDDGLSYDYQEGAYLEVKVSYQEEGRQMRLEWQPQNTPRRFNPPEYVLLRFYQVRRPTSVAVNERPIRLLGDSFGVVESDRTTAWYENDNTLLIKLFSPAREQVIDIVYP